jgi:hypothetical protein
MFPRHHCLRRIGVLRHTVVAGRCLTKAPAAVDRFDDRPVTIARRASWSPDGQHVYAALSHQSADIVRLEGLL